MFLKVVCVLNFVLYILLVRFLKNTLTNMFDLRIIFYTYLAIHFILHNYFFILFLLMKMLYWRNFLISSIPEECHVSSVRPIEISHFGEKTMVEREFYREINF